MLCGDVKKNPGPSDSEIMLMTQNCRRLNNINKLRQLIENKNKKQEGLNLCLHYKRRT